MTITLDTLDFLASAQGAALLTRLLTADLSDSHVLPLLTRLRREYTPEQAGAALELTRLRLKAVDKFGDNAARMFFTRAALEQASDPRVRRYRARQTGAISLVDACCGIGADTISFVQGGCTVSGIDHDPLRVAMARLNTAACDLHAAFAVGDVRDGLPAAAAVFFDPARRDADDHRIHAVERYLPPLSTIQRWQHPLIIVKLSPGVDLPQLAPYPGGVEFISVSGDLKEACLWLGAGWIGKRAVLLTDAGEFIWQAGETAAETTLAEPRGWLVEPDPALIRAGLVAEAAAAFHGSQLDATTAYFTTDSRPESPWVRAWKILDWLPFNLKKLRAYLRERHIGQVTVKKRGTAVTPDDLIPRLRLVGDRSCTLVLTRAQAKQIVLICEDMAVP